MIRLYVQIVIFDVTQRLCMGVIRNDVHVTYSVFSKQKHFSAFFLYSAFS